MQVSLVRRPWEEPEEVAEEVVEEEPVKVGRCVELGLVDLI
jgi:hypothetical protein